jgi:hypothetical protein
MLLFFKICVSLQHYYEFGRMMVKLAEAIGRLVLSGREMTRLAGFTARVTDLIKVLKDLNQGKYVRTMVGNTGSVVSVVDNNTDNGLACKELICKGRGKGKVVPLLN